MFFWGGVESGRQREGECAQGARGGAGLGGAESEAATRRISDAARHGEASLIAQESLVAASSHPDRQRITDGAMADCNHSFSHPVLPMNHSSSHTVLSWNH